MTIQLPATLQTCQGMVQNSGRPQLRPLPKDFADLEPIRSSCILPMESRQRLAWSAHVVAYIRSEYGVIPMPYKPDNHEYLDWTANLAACKTKVTVEDLKSYMRKRTRLDLEQTAAVVISAFVTAGRKEDAVKLFEETRDIMKKSCMWIDPEEPLHHRRVQSKGVENIARKLQTSAARRGIEIPSASSISELVPLLLRVRRSKPTNRCLMIPQWMLDEAQIPAPPHFQATFDSNSEDPYHHTHPIAPPPDHAIFVSRHHFNVYQSKILALFQYWIPAINLRSRIKKLADNVLYGSKYLDSRVFDITDVALLSYYFFQFQRRMQRKVVSTNDGGEFLAKGEARGIYQNNLAMKSTFEVVLEQIVDESSEGVIVVMGKDDTLDLIDQTCRLMKEYADVYGLGKTSNLTFKQGEKGGGGRGPVDEYNLLCDALDFLRQQARDEGIIDLPGPTRKFLAKDIMNANETWGDDAFAGGRKGGWEGWLERRGGPEAGNKEEEWEIVVR